MAEEMFKTTLMGGFDKDDVLTKIQKIKDEEYAEKAKLIKEKKDRDKKIDSLREQLRMKNQEIEEAIVRTRQEKDLEIQELNKEMAQKDKQIMTLQRTITEKYQKYIDRYDLIGSLILESQERSERIIADAEKKRDQLMEEARIEAQRYLDDVQREVDEKLAEGKRQYVAVQEEMYGIVGLINQIQKKFMTSYKEVHQLVGAMPTSGNKMGELDNPDAEDYEVETDVLE